jgi:hypothetical protein
MAPEVAEAFPVLYLTQLPRKMYSQPIVHKALSWSTIRKAVCILAAITIRKSQVYFPARLDFASPQQGWTRFAREVFQTYGIPLLDMTSCVSQVSPAERFVILHYSSVTNAAVANCLLDVIGQASQR